MNKLNLRIFQLSNYVWADHILPYDMVLWPTGSKSKKGENVFQYGNFQLQGHPCLIIRSLDNLMMIAIFGIKWLKKYIAER